MDLNSQKIMMGSHRSTVKVEDSYLSHSDRKKRHVVEESVEQRSFMDENSKRIVERSGLSSVNVVNRLLEYGENTKKKLEFQRDQRGKDETFEPTLVAKKRGVPKVTSTGVVVNIDADNSFQKSETDILQVRESDKNIHLDDEIQAMMKTEDATHRVSKAMIKHMEKEKEKCTFKPQLCDNSRKIMSLRSRYETHIDNEPVAPQSYQRLYNLSQQPKIQFEPNYSYKPEINPNSKAIIELMRGDNEYDGEERWKGLYKFGTEKQISRRELADRIAEIKDLEESKLYTYAPSIDD